MDVCVAVSSIAVAETIASTRSTIIKKTEHKQKKQKRHETTKTGMLERNDVSQKPQSQS